MPRRDKQMQERLEEQCKTDPGDIPLKYRLALQPQLQLCTNTRDRFSWA